MLSGLRENNDDGDGLIELIVGMTLMTIVAAIALTFFVGTTKQANRVTGQSLVGARAQVAMTQIAAALRLADTPTASAGYSTGRFVTMTANEVEFFSDISPTNRSGTAIRSAPTEVDLVLSNGVLSESLYAPRSSTVPANYLTNYSSTPTSTSQLVTGLTNSTTNPTIPVFTYCSDETDPSSTCTATTNPASVAMVFVTLAVGAAPGATPFNVQTGIAIDGQVS